MRVAIGSRVFVPQAWATLLTAVAVAAFVSLGWWQVGRAREKQALVESFARGTQTSVELLTDVAIDDLPRYQHLRAEGRYEPAYQVLLDNMPSQSGRPGYRILTPFRRQGSDRLLLVDRGWVPLGASREALPAIGVTAEHRAVSGRLDQLPVPGVRVGAATEEIIGLPEASKKKAREELVASHLTRYLDQLQAKLTAAGGEYFADRRLTVADLKVAMLIRWLRSGVLDHVPKDLVDTVAPQLVKHFERVTSHPKVAEYYQRRKAV